MKFSVQPRAAVQRMLRYHPPLSGRTGLRLEFNENTVACSPAVQRALAAITAESLTRYPERASVESRVAEHFRLKPEQVLLTNGADEAIHTLCSTFLDHGDQMLLPVPTYSMYQVYASATDAEICTVQADAGFAFPAEQLQRAILPSTKLIAIANPNSPTGSVAQRRQLVSLAESAPSAIVLVDEAYFHFHGETVMDLVGSLPNLVVLRTFSKAYGLAGLRIGALCGATECVDLLRRVVSPYSVNQVALACLPAALDDAAYLNWYVDEVIQAREEFEKWLSMHSLELWPSRANFFLVHIGPAHAAFCDSMRARGVLVRDRSSDPGCEGCVRITIGTREQMRHAALICEQVLSEIGVL